MKRRELVEMIQEVLDEGGGAKDIADRLQEEFDDLVEQDEDEEDEEG